jgi:hypothetical protein
MWCALVVAGATALFGVLSLFGLRVMGASLATLFDAALFAAIAYFPQSCDGGSCPVRSFYSHRDWLKQLVVAANSNLALTTM